MPGPTLNEVRAKGQPPEVLARLNDEHWFGRLYMRKLSPYATVMFARLGWSPNAVTVCFMLAGVAAGVLTAVPGLAAAIGVALLIQLYPGTGNHGELAGVGALFCTYLRGEGRLLELTAACLARHGLPRTPADLGLSQAEFTKAVLHAPATRPGRYTILERLDLDERAIAERVEDFVAAIRSDQ